MMVKKVRDAADAKILLSNGENPYEIQRQFLSSKLQQRHKCQTEHAIAAGKERILKQLLCEEHAWSKELKAAARKQDCERAFQREMGGAAMEEKVSRYLLKNTKACVEMLDPTGRRPVFPSDVIVGKARQVSEELPIPCTTKPSGRELVLSDTMNPMASKHSFQGSWAMDDGALRGPPADETFRRCKEHHGMINVNPALVSAGCEDSTRPSAFIADPGKVVFADFEPGSTYSVCVKLTNATGKRATCRALEPAASVADVLELEMQPPGFLSSGMSCYMQLKFKPKTIEDLHTHVTLVTHDGELILPVECHCKNSKLSVSPSLIEFGLCVIGDTMTRTFELQNSGALQVKYSVTGSVVVADFPAGCDVDLRKSQTGSPPAVDRKDSSLRIGPFKIDHQQGTCGGYKTVRIGVVFEPLVVGESEGRLEVVCKPLSRYNVAEKHFVVLVQGTCTDLPVKSRSDMLDFKTCMMGKAYRGLVCVQNSSHVAMKAHIHAPLCTAGFISFTPTCAFVQGFGELPFSVDFFPTAAILQRCSKYISSDPLSIEVPISVTVSGQPYPLRIVAKATITDHMLQLGALQYDLGICNVNECVMCPVTISNPTDLEQTFAFSSMPADVSVQSNTGCIPPKGFVQVKVIFTPRVQGLRTFSVQMNSLCLSAATLSFTATVAQPKLTLSHNLVKLKATTFSGTASASVMLQNHAATAQRFAFEKNDSLDLSITPAFGCLAAGANLRLQIDHTPTGGHAQSCLGNSNISVPIESSDTTRSVFKGPPGDTHAPPGPRGAPMSHTLTCFFSPDGQYTGVPAFLNLEVRTCEVAPSVLLVGAVVDPHSARYTCDFGVSSVGSSNQAVLGLKNVSSDDLIFKFKPTNPFGPFQQVTACAFGKAMDTTPLRLQFEPKVGGIFTELLHIQAGPITLLCELRGAAEKSEWELKVQDRPDDMSTLPGVGSEALMLLDNPCQFPLSCTLTTLPECVKNIGNCPPVILYPSSMIAASREATAVRLSYRPDWQGPHFSQSMNVANPGGKDVVLRGSMLAGSLRICGGRYVCADLHLPPTLAPGCERVDHVMDGLVAFPSITWGEQQSIEIHLQNVNPATSTGEMRVSFQHITMEERSTGWQVQPTELFIAPDQTETIRVSLHLPDHIPEACAWTLGYQECLSLRLLGTAVDLSKSPETTMILALTVRSHSSG